jgi:hypothetical protein
MSEMKVDDESTSEEENPDAFLQKVSKKYVAKIKKDKDLLEFIDRQRNVKKAKEFGLPIEITNYIMNAVLNKMNIEKIKGEKGRSSIAPLAERSKRLNSELAAQSAELVKSGNDQLSTLNKNLLK